MQSSWLKPAIPRLHPRACEISQLQKISEATAIRQALAANPNLDEELLWDLAIECPAAVADNPGLQLIQLREPDWWTQCGTGALLTLLSVMGEKAPEEARGYLFDDIVKHLMSINLLNLVSEYTSTLSHDISIDWQPKASTDPIRNECSDDDALNEETQDFSLDFTCKGEWRFFATRDNEPANPEELYASLAALLPDPEGALDPQALEANGWKQDDEMGDGYWDLECVRPSLPECEFDSSIHGDGTGTVTATDPSGFIHEVELDELEYDTKISKPILEEDISSILPIQGLDLPSILCRLKAAFLLE